MLQEDQQPQTQAAEEPADEEAALDPAAALQEERDQYKALAQRTQADFINYKRRVEEERSLLARNAANGVIVRFLPVLDDLQRAIDALPEDAPRTWREGVEMILQNMESILQAEGVVSTEPAPGESFDPSEHEAVYYQPSAELGPGNVLSTVRRGYRTKDRVLRPAQVVVAREPEEQSFSGPEETDPGTDGKQTQQ